MLEQIENPMVIDVLHEKFERVPEETREKLNGSGYWEMGTGIFVPEEDAFQYAAERIANGTEDEKQEFKEMFVDWFYSGNWIYKE